MATNFWRQWSNFWQACFVFGHHVFSPFAYATDHHIFTAFKLLPLLHGLLSRISPVRGFPVSKMAASHTIRPWGLGWLILGTSLRLRKTAAAQFFARIFYELCKILGTSHGKSKKEARSKMSAWFISQSSGCFLHSQVVKVLLFTRDL